MKDQYGEVFPIGTLTHKHIPEDGFLGSELYRIKSLYLTKPEAFNLLVLMGKDETEATNYLETLRKRDQ